MKKAFILLDSYDNNSGGINTKNYIYIYILLIQLFKHTFNFMQRSIDKNQKNSVKHTTQPFKDIEPSALLTKVILIVLVLYFLVIQFYF